MGNAVDDRLANLPGVVACSLTDEAIAVVIDHGADPRLVKARAQVACAELGETRPVLVVGGVAPPRGGARGGRLAAAGRRATNPTNVAVVTMAVLAGLVLPIGGSGGPGGAPVVIPPVALGRPAPGPAAAPPAPLPASPDAGEGSAISLGPSLAGPPTSTTGRLAPRASGPAPVTAVPVPAPMRAPALATVAAARPGVAPPAGAAALGARGHAPTASASPAPAGPAADPAPTPRSTPLAPAATATGGEGEATAFEATPRTAPLATAAAEDLEGNTQRGSKGRVAGHDPRREAAPKGHAQRGDSLSPQAAGDAGDQGKPSPGAQANAGPGRGRQAGHRPPPVS